MERSLNSVMSQAEEAIRLDEELHKHASDVVATMEKDIEWGFFSSDYRDIKKVLRKMVKIGALSDKERDGLMEGFGTDLYLLHGKAPVTEQDVRDAIYRTAMAKGREYLLSREVDQGEDDMKVINRETLEKLGGAGQVVKHEAIDSRKDGVVFSRDENPVIAILDKEEQKVAGVDFLDMLFYAMQRQNPHSRALWEAPIEWRIPNALAPQMLSMYSNKQVPMPEGTKLATEFPILDFSTPWTVEKYGQMFSQISSGDHWSYAVEAAFGDFAGGDALKGVKKWWRNKDFLHVDQTVLDYLTGEGWKERAIAELRDAAPCDVIEMTGLGSRYKEEGGRETEIGNLPNAESVFTATAAGFCRRWVGSWKNETKLGQEPLYLKNFKHMPLGGSNTMLVFPSNYHVPFTLPTGYGVSTEYARIVGMHVCTEEVGWSLNEEEMHEMARSIVSDAHSSFIENTTKREELKGETGVVGLVAALISEAVGDVDMGREFLEKYSNGSLQTMTKRVEDLACVASSAGVWRDHQAQIEHSSDALEEVRKLRLFSEQLVKEIVDISGSSILQQVTKERKSRRLSRKAKPGNRPTITSANLIVEQKVHCNSMGKTGYVIFTFGASVATVLGLSVKLVDALRYNNDIERPFQEYANNILTNLCYAEERRIMIRHEVESTSKPKKKRGKKGKGRKGKASNVKRYKLLIDLDDECMVDVKTDRVGTARAGTKKEPHPRTLAEYYTAWVLPENVREDDLVLKRGMKNDKEQVFVERERKGGAREISVNGWEPKEVEETRREGTLSIF